MKLFLTSITVSVLVVQSALGLGAEIRSPEIGHGPDLGQPKIEKVEGIVRCMRDELTLIEGFFVNEFSSQRFGGSSEKVSRLIRLLVEAEVWKVQVAFREFGEQESAFILSQSSPDVVTLVVNSGRDDFLLKDFQTFLRPPGELAPVKGVDGAGVAPGARPGQDPGCREVPLIDFHGELPWRDRAER